MLTLTKALGTLASPPAILILAALLGLLLQLKWRLLGTALLLFSLTALLVMSLPVVGQQWMAELESQAHPLPPSLKADKARLAASAIVILGAGRYAQAPELGGEDTVSSHALERLRYGAQLHRETGLPILVTGGAPFGDQTPEAVLMQRALERDFQVKARWVEARSATTFENARDSQALLHPAGVRHVLLVTHAWHMPRALWVFEAAGLQVTPAPTAFTTLDAADRGPLGYLPSARGLFLSARAWHERLGLWWYKLRHHPDLPWSEAGQAAR